MKITLLLLILLLTLPATFSLAQDQPSTTLPPRLFLVVLLDNSGTMIGDTSSQVAGRPAANQRRGSDANKARHAAVERILEQLSMDGQEHRVAVLSFAQGENQLVWLTSDETIPNGRAISLGNNLDRAPYQRFLDELKALPNGNGPGNVTLAMEQAQAEVARYGEELRNYKLVVLLIADDVPIVDFPSSPWQGGPNSWQPARTAFEAALAKPDWVNLARYKGPCQHDSGQPLMSAITLGNANWVDSAGQIIAPNQVNQALASGSTYYQAVLNREGAQRLDGSGPLVYAVDPLLNSQNLDALFLRAGQDWLSEVLCLWHDHNQPSSFEGDPTLSSSGLIEIKDEPNINNTTTYTLPMSLLYAQVRLLVEGQGSVRVLMTNGQELPIAPTELSYSGGGISRQTRLWTLSRSDPTISHNAWDGLWRIQVSGPNNANAAIHFMRHLIPDELSWRLTRSVSEAYDPTQNHSLDVQLVVRKAGEEVVVRPSDLIRTVTGVMCPNNARNPVLTIPYEGAETSYQGSSDRDETLDGETYRFYVRYELARPVVGSVIEVGDCSSQAEDRYRTISLSFRSTEQLSIESPNDGQGWECSNGRQTIKARLTLSSGSDTRADSLNSYAAVQVFYPLPTLQASPPPTPALVLQWQGGEDSRFEGDFDCSILSEGRSRIMIRAVFPNSRDKTEERGLSFSPTNTPTPTPTQAATAVPTLIPTPLPPSFQSDLEPLRDANFIPVVVIVAASAMSLGGLSWTIQRYQRLRQQRRVIIENAEGKRSLLIRGLWEVLPLRTRFTYKDDAHQVVFQLDVRPQRLILTLVPPPESWAKRMKSWLSPKAQRLPATDGPTQESLEGAPTPSSAVSTIAAQLDGQPITARTPYRLNKKETEILIKDSGRYLIIYPSWRQTS